MKRVLITGANGLLGQQLVARFANRLEVFATARQAIPDIFPSKVHFFELDITDPGPCKKLIHQIQPDVIINAAAYTDVDGCEINKEICWQVNVKGVENLAGAAKKNMALLIHFSTDYIFDGLNGPYDENDKPNPLGFYGKTKLASENQVRLAGIPYAIVRTNVIFGTGVNVKNNFFLWLFNQLNNNQNINVVTDQYNNPVAAEELARAISLLVEKSKYGVYHIAGKEYLSRYQFACAVADVFGFDKNLINPITTAMLKQNAPRPMKGGLKIELSKKDIGFRPKPLEEILVTLKQKLESGLTGNL